MGKTQALPDTRPFSIRATIGHNFNRYHRHMIAPWIDPECRLCQQADEENRRHILKDFTAIAGLRLAYCGEYYLGDAWEPSLLLDMLHDPIISKKTI
jgi:hypothetical protein